MNFFVSSMGSNITISLLSSFASTSKGIYGLIAQMKHSGKSDIKKVIDDMDLLTTLKIIQCLIMEIDMNKEQPITLQICLKSLIEIIHSIHEELEKINYRLQYNDSLWIGRTIRSYGFNNCEKRLDAYIKKLENRKKLLIDILSVKNHMFRNQHIANTVSDNMPKFIDNDQNQ